MQDRCKLIDYKIPKLMFGVEIKQREKKKRNLSFHSNVKVAVSESDKKKGLVAIRVDVSDEDEEVKYSFEIRGIFEFEEEDLSEEEQENILGEEGFEKLYLKANEVIKQMQKITNQGLPDLPSYDELIERG